jgi:hypothetical protein
MARWKLLEAHYLSVPENYWEQTETDRDTGKQKRKKYPVPTHLDPKDPGVWTHKSGERDITQGGNAFTDGEIVVRWEEGYTYTREDGKVFTCKVGPDKTQRGHLDLVFVGPPTPGMEPLDDEAKAISAAFDWVNIANDKYFGMSYAERLIFDKVTNEDGQQKQMADAIAMMSELMKANTALMQKLAGTDASRRL